MAKAAKKKEKIEETVDTVPENAATKLRKLIIRNLGCIAETVRQWIARGCPTGGCPAG